MVECRRTGKAIAGDEIGGYFIPANSIIVLSPYLTHRHPAFWQDPEAFDPERFTPERSASRPCFGDMIFSLTLSCKSQHLGVQSFSWCGWGKHVGTPLKLREDGSPRNKLAAR